MHSAQWKCRMYSGESQKMTRGEKLVEAHMKTCCVEMKRLKRTFACSHYIVKSPLCSKVSPLSGTHYVVKCVVL